MSHLSSLLSLPCPFPAPIPAPIPAPLHAPHPCPRVVSLDATHYQAWASLGALFWKNAELKREGLHCFRESCKLRSDEARLWYNCAAAAAELGFHEEAVYRLRRLHDLGGTIEPATLALVVDAVRRDSRPVEGGQSAAGRMLANVRELIALLCEQQPHQRDYWETRLYLERAKGDGTQQLRAVRGWYLALHATLKWKTEAAELEQCVEALAQLVEAQCEQVFLFRNPDTHSSHMSHTPFSPYLRI